MAAHVPEGVVGTVLFGLLFIVSLVRLIQILIASPDLSKITPKAFHVFCTLTAVIRMGWCISKLVLGHKDPEPMVLNRIALMFFLSTFSLIIQSWIEIFHSKGVMIGHRAGKEILFGYCNWPMSQKQILVLINVVVYIWQIIVILVLTLHYWDPVLYEANIITLILTFFILSLLFLVYGLLLAKKVKEQRSKAGLTSTSRTSIKLVVATAVYSSAFLIRTFAFIWRPAMEAAGYPKSIQYWPWSLFLTFAYIVPELIPPLFQLYIMRYIESKGTAGMSKAETVEMSSARVTV